MQLLQFRIIFIYHPKATRPTRHVVWHGIPRKDVQRRGVINNRGAFNRGMGSKDRLGYIVNAPGTEKSLPLSVKLLRLQPRSITNPLLEEVDLRDSLRVIRRVKYTLIFQKLNILTVFSTGSDRIKLEVEPRVISLLKQQCMSLV